MISPPLSPAQAVWLSCVLKAAAGTSVPNDGEKSPMYSPRVFFFFFFGTKRERDKKDLKREIRHSLDLIVCCGKREREERRSRGEKLRPGSDTFRSNPPPSFKVFFYFSLSLIFPPSFALSNRTSNVTRACDPGLVFRFECCDERSQTSTFETLELSVELSAGVFSK